MGVAADMRKMVAKRGDANLEFAQGGYRLSLNPIEGRLEEVGFILWREEAGGALAPVATGQAVGNDLVVDGEPGGTTAPSGIEGVVASLIAGEPVSVLGSQANEQAIPTGT